MLDLNVREQEKHGNINLDPRSQPPLTPQQGLRVMQTHTHNREGLKFLPFPSTCSWDTRLAQFMAVD